MIKPEKWIVVLIAAVIASLSGCAEFSAVKTGVASHGAQAADEALIVSEWGVCQATTMGAWQRRYGADPVKADGWRKLCSQAAVTP